MSVSLFERQSPVESSDPGASTTRAGSLPMPIFLAFPRFRCWPHGERIASRMTSRTASRLAWAIGIVSIALMIGALALMYIDRGTELPTTDVAVASSWNFANVLNSAVNIAATCFGILLASRRPKNPIGWLFLTAGLTLGISAFGTAYGLHALLVEPGSLPAGRAAAWDLQLHGPDPARHPVLPVPAVSDRSSEIVSLARGRVVRRGGVHDRHRVLRGVRNDELGRPVRPASSGGSPLWVLLLVLSVGGPRCAP